MKEKEKYLEDVYEILREVEKEKSKYWIRVLGKRFVVYPDVFSPKYFRGTELFSKELSIRKGEEFLEIGCGTGIVSIFALLNGASRAVLTDINPAAIRNARENVKIHGLENKTRVIQGDIFDPLRNERFDTIFWNPPYSYTKRRNLTMLEKSILDPEYRSLRKFIRDARKHLKPDGRLLIGFSPTIGHTGFLKQLLKGAGYGVRLIKEMYRMRVVRGVETYPIKFQIFEAKPGKFSNG